MAGRCGRSVTTKKALLSQARTIYDYVKVDKLIPEFAHPECFLMHTLKNGSLAACKFIACLMLEPEHSGHREIAKELMDSLPCLFFGKGTSSLL